MGGIKGHVGSICRSKPSEVVLSRVGTWNEKREAVRDGDIILVLTDREWVTCDYNQISWCDA